MKTLTAPINPAAVLAVTALAFLFLIVVGLGRPAPAEAGSAQTAVVPQIVALLAGVSTR